MSRFIYVFEKRAAKDLLKRGYELIKEDKSNQLWVFANKEGKEIDFTANYQMVLSDVISL